MIKAQKQGLQKKDRISTIFSTILLLVLLSVAPLVSANPSGADITYNSTAGVPYTTPGSRADSRGTITTLILNATQQVQTWKGYVGNVSGALSLKDSDGYALYDWDLTGVTITGQVYATRDSSVDFTSVQCASQSTIASEESFYNMTSTQGDNINHTFEYTNHTSFYVGSTPIAANTCKSTATYINSTRQTVDENAKFQEVLLEQSGSLIFTTIIEDNQPGYRQGSTYDFQMIVPESPVKTTPTTYYFFTEIGTA